VEQHNEEKDHAAQKCCGQLRVFLDHDAQGCGNQGDTHQIDPKQMRRNPGGDHGGHQPANGEVFPCENSQGNGVEETAERHELVEAVRLWDFVFQDERQADGQDSKAGEIWPEDGCGD